MNKLKTAVGNGIWQLLPSMGTMLLSLLIVRLFDTAVWGTIVGVIVIQQVLNSIISWGNKDFLQRELALNHLEFNFSFTAFLQERFMVFVFAIGCCYLFDWVSNPFFLGFCMLVLAKFLQQSFDILVLREKRFVLVTVLEVVFLILQLLLLLYLHQIGIKSPSTLFVIFWLPSLIKSIILLVIFRNYLERKLTPGTYLKKSFFFGLLSFSGLVHSKIDLLLISKLLDASSLGKYQIIMAFLWNIQSVAMYVSGPYVHNFYRLSEFSQNNYAHFLRRLSYWIVPVGVMLMSGILYFVLHLQLSISILMASLLFSMMSFIYLPWILQLNQRKLEFRVLTLNILGILLLVSFILVINNLIGLTLENMIWIVTVHQLFITAIAFVANKIKS